MTPEEVARVLAKCAAYDQRTVGRADIAAWAEVLDTIDLVDALPAVTAHYRNSTQRAMPADIRERALELRDRRQRAEGRTALAALPPGRHQDDPDRNARIAEGVAKARAALPLEPLGDSVYRRAVARARQERGRPEPLARRSSDKKHADAPDPADESVAVMAKHYLRDGHDPATVADRLGISRKWCAKQARRLAPMGPVGWCGECTYTTRVRKPDAHLPAEKCPKCHPDLAGGEP